VFITILSSISGNHFGPPPFSWADKFVHATLFAIGTWPLFVVLRHGLRLPIPATAAITFVLMVLIGIGDEIHQLYTPGRSGGDIGDITADAAGAVIGIALSWLLHGNGRSKSNLPAASGNPAA
jgi:VanZ family protein